MSWRTEIANVDTSKDYRSFLKKFRDIYSRYEHTLELEKALLEANVGTLTFLDPSEELYMYAVQIWENALFFIKNPSYDVMVKAVESFSGAIYYVKEQTEELCLLACKKNGQELANCEFQTEEICKVAMENDPDSIRCIENQTEEFCWTALRHNVDNIRFIDSPTEEMVWYAVYNDVDPSCLKWLEISTVTKIDIVKHNIVYLFPFSECEEVVNAAYEEYGSSVVEYLLTPPYDWCLELVLQDPSMFNSIPYEMMLPISKELGMFKAELNKALSYYDSDDE